MTWSSGSKLNSDTVAKAFKQGGNNALFQRTDVSPLSGVRGVGCSTVIIVVVVILISLVLLSRCSRCEAVRENCSTRMSGGSFGGLSGGGGHKYQG